jgi:hypothetical protein
MGKLNLSKEKIKIILGKEKVGIVLGRRARVNGKMEKKLGNWKVKMGKM